MPADDTQEALRKAVDGLTFQSETDAPWQPFRWPEAKGAPTADGVKQFGNHKASAPATEQPLEQFIAPLVQDQDWFGDEEKATAAKYRALRDLIAQRLQNAKVIRVGNRKVTLYVVGTDKAGGWAGAKTTAVET